MAKLDTIIHQPMRLQIMSALMAVDPAQQVEFTYLRNLLKATDGNLGAHLAKLEEAGYIEIEKTFVDRKPRTFIRIAGKGRDAFAEHVAALNAILQNTTGATKKKSKRPKTS